MEKCFKRRFDNVIPLIMFTSLRLEAYAERNIFKQFDFTASNFRIMAMIDRLGPTFPSEIVTLLGFSKSNLTQRLSFMAKAGLVHKEKKDDDGRKIVVSLTKEGKEKYLQALKIAKKKNKELGLLFNDKELDNYFDFMQKLNLNLGKSDIFSC